MVTRSISQDGGERGNPHSSKDPPRKASVTWAKLPTHKNSQQSEPDHSKSIQEHVNRTPGAHPSNLGNKSEVDDEFQRSSVSRVTNLPLSNIKLERRRSFGMKPDRDREGPKGAQRNERRFSFAVGHDADQGSAAETWQIFVDDQERRGAAQYLERDQKLHDPDQHELQSLVAALFDRNAALQNEIVNIKADDTEKQRQKASKNRRFLSVRMPGLIDKYDFDSDEEEDLESAMQNDYETHRPQQTKHVDPQYVEGQPNKQPNPKPDNQVNDEVSASVLSSHVRLESQDCTRQQLEQSTIEEETQKHEEASIGNHSMISSAPTPGNVERMLELEKQFDDLTKRHNAARQENAELKKERRAIQAERDRFKLENFKLQRTRSDEQYEKLREQYKELQEQTQELLRQRQELLDMSNQMASKLPEFRAVQTDNLRQQQLFWEHERARRNGPPRGQIAEEGSSTSTDTLMALRRNRAGPVEHATPLQHSTNTTNTRDPDETQPVPLSSNIIESLATNRAALKSRQGSTAPIAPGKGLEESRRNGPGPLKERPGSIVRPNRQVRGLPKAAERGPPSYHRVRDLAQPDVTRSPTKPSSQISDVDSINSMEYSGGSNAMHTADHIDVGHMVSQTPPNTPGNWALPDNASRRRDYADVPRAGMTPYFETVKTYPTAINTRAVIKYDLQASDELYKFHKFSKGDQVFVFVDGMHQLWPVKLSEDPEAELYILPRNAIALVCDHGYEYNEMYVVIRSWYEKFTSGVKSEYMSVECNQHLHCAHTFETEPEQKGGEVRTWRCMKSQDGKRRGLVPAQFLKKLNAFAAPLLTASLCPCANPQPYTGRARVLVDCQDLSGGLSFKDGAEIEVAHLDTNLKAYCVRDPHSKIPGLVDPRFLRKIHNATEGDNYEKYVLDLTPKYFDFMTSELTDIEETEADIRAAFNGPRPTGSMSEEAKRRWESNLDGTNTDHKKFEEEIQKCRPASFNHWLRWNEKGLPPVVGHSIIKSDLETIKKGKKFKRSILNEINWKLFLDTFPINPIGPSTGTRRARSRSVPALRNPAYLNEKEQERERLINKPLHIGHQPHKKIADGVCPDRDYMSEPVNGEPHDMKRRYIYVRENGDMLACEAETAFNVHDLDIWRTARKSGKDWIAARKHGPLMFEPVEEDVNPSLFEGSIQNSADFFACAKDSLERADFDVIDMLHAHKKHGLSLVYGLKRNQGSTSTSSDGTTAHERFEIIDMPEPEMRSAGFEARIQIRRVKTKAWAGTTPDDNPSHETSRDETYIIPALELDPVPYLRTAVFKDEPMPDYLMPRERDNYRFVLLRESSQDEIWDALQGGKVIATKLDMIELENTSLWKPLNSVLAQIQLAYQQKEVMDDLNKNADTQREADPTDSAPKIEDWDFWYPVIQGLTGFGNGFVDIDEPNVETGEPVDYVQIVPGSEHPETHMCTARKKKQTGLVHASAIDMSRPFLQSFTALEADGSPGDADFLWLKERKLEGQNTQLFMASNDNGMGWMDAKDILFDEDEYRMIPLLEMFDKEILNIDEFDGASTYLEQFRSVADKQSQSTVFGTPRSGRTLRTDSSGPPMSLYCPRSVPEPEGVMSSVLDVNAPASSQGMNRPVSIPGEIAQSTRRRSPRDFAIAKSDTEGVMQQPEGRRAKSTTNSTTGMIDLPILQLDRTFQAPEVPVETKPVQNGNRPTSLGTDSGNASGAVEPDAEEAEVTPTTLDSNGNELMIRYDDWVKREEVYAKYIDTFGSLLTLHGRLTKTIPRPVMGKAVPAGFVRMAK